MPFLDWAVQTHLVCRSLLDGRYEEAALRSQRAVEAGRRTSVTAVEGVHGLQMFTVSRDRGQLKTVRPVLEQFLSKSTDVPWIPGLALLYAELDATDRAREAFELAARDDFEIIPKDTGWGGSMAYLAEVCAFVGDSERAQQIHDLLLPYAEVAILLGGIVVCLGSGSRFLGLLSALRRRWREAETHFEKALEFNTALGVLPALIRTRHDYASMLLKRRRGQDVARAAELIADGLRDARSIGMRNLVERLEGLESAAAAHNAKNTVNYPDGLSAREMEVLRLIVEGSTNREIAAELYISEKTVHNHVGRLLSKTGCANRAEAASYAVRKHLA